ncbi:glutaredoxin domain-containing protein [Priestia aryabhattai]|uniref:glutaredoxin family protein n=1 Tax=Priestia aryabhattai TaxID=412384 RepID=UPI003981C71B
MVIKNVQLELYARLDCSYCKAGKEFLSKHSVSYNMYDLAKEPFTEEDLIKITGTRIVPTFVFKS